MCILCPLCSRYAHWMRWFAYDLFHSVSVFCVGHRTGRNISPRFYQNPLPHLPWVLAGLSFSQIQIVPWWTAMSRELFSSKYFCVPPSQQWNRRVRRKEGVLFTTFSVHGQIVENFEIETTCCSFFCAAPSVYLELWDWRKADKTDRDVSKSVVD